MSCQCSLCKSLKKIDRLTPKDVKFDFFKTSDDEKTKTLKQRLSDTVKIVKKKGVQ